jgi:RNA polymerase sigma-70 factor, ECF subfamily
MTATAAAFAAAVPTVSFDEVILPLRPALMRAAQVLTRDPDETGDLVQDALERALRSFDRFTPGTNARAWSMAILSRLFVDRWRMRRRRLRWMSPDCPDPDSVGQEQPERAPTWDAITLADIKRAAAELPASLREVFELHAFMHRSYADISEITGIPMMTVGTRLLRARRRIRATLIEQMEAAETGGTRARSAA